jgi:hypothetical protein
VVMNTLDSTVADCFVFSRKCIFPLFFSVAYVVVYIFRLSVSRIVQDQGIEAIPGCCPVVVQETNIRTQTFV